MKKLLWLMIAFILLVIVTLLIQGCSTQKYKDGKLVYDSSNNFFGKSVNVESNVYGAEVALTSSQTVTPAFRLGLSNIALTTVPMQKGQSFYIERSSSNVINSNVVTKTIIHIGAAKSDGVLQVEDYNGDITVTEIAEEIDVQKADT